MANTNEATVPLSLSPRQAERLDGAAEGLSKEQLIWSSGYLAGLASRTVPAPELKPVYESDESVVSQTLTILYGSQTGNGRELAETLFSQATARGLNAMCVDMADYAVRDIGKERWLALIVSTHGEGEAPDDAELLLEFLQSKRAPKLDSLNYFVLALGDSSYARFCQTGKEFDQQLETLGATRLSDRVDCDVDYESPAAQWAETSLNLAQDRMRSSDPKAAAPRVPLQVVDNNPAYSKSRPFTAEVLANQRITGNESSKVVHHLELSLADSGLDYAPGDAVGVITTNPPELVDEVIAMLGVRSESVIIADESRTLEEALTNDLELTLNSGAFLSQYAELTGNAELLGALADSPQRQALISEYQVIDVLREYPFRVDASTGVSVQAFTDALRPLAPRLYSIASSPVATPGEVHITVAQLSYQAFGKRHAGTASTALIETLEEGGHLPLYIDKNPRFRLPDNPDTDIIMIGPGTGVAPFRAFVQHRAEIGAKGRNWLFFGDRNLDEDFLYQTEWQGHLQRNNLHRIDVAFSRDQDKKVYVQERLLENASDVYSWISSGASIYVCGDATSMAPDVHAALVSIVSGQGNQSEEAAERYLKKLKRDRRYLRDVY